MKNSRMTSILTISIGLALAGWSVAPILVGNADARNHANGLSTTTNSNNGGSLDGNGPGSSHSKSSSNGFDGRSGENGRSFQSRGQAQTSGSRSNDATNGETNAVDGSGSGSHGVRGSKGRKANKVLSPWSVNNWASPLVVKKLNGITVCIEACQTKNKSWEFAK